MVGNTARAEDLDLNGIDSPLADVEEALSAPAKDWAKDLDDNEAYLKFLGDKVPSEVHEEFAALRKRIEDAL